MRLPPEWTFQVGYSALPQVVYSMCYGVYDVYFSANVYYTSGMFIYYLKTAVLENCGLSDTVSDKSIR